MRSVSSINTQSSTLVLPAWLSKAQTASYRKAGLQLLAKREFIRSEARDKPRPQSAGLARFRPTSDISQELVDHYSVATGYLPENEYKNRYFQLEPYDRTRVVVGSSESEPLEVAEGGNGRYLNASWVQELYGRKWWIANQAPLPHTSHAFLSVILQAKTSPPISLRNPEQPLLASGRVRTIVQLTQNIEGGRTKAHPYFPDQIGQSLIITPEPNCNARALKSTLLGTKHHEEALCIESIVSVVPVAWYKIKEGSEEGSDHKEEDVDYGEDDADPISFRHLLYYAWPDHGVPSSSDRASLLKFIRLVDTLNKTPVSPNSAAQSSATESDPPIMVGCSAGIGRTGTFIALSSLLRAFGFLDRSTTQKPRDHTVPPRGSSDVVQFQSPLGSIPEPFADDMVIQEVDSLREQRPGMVQQDQQILLIYEVLTSELESQKVGR